MNYITTNEEMTKIVNAILNKKVFIGDSGLDDFIDGTLSFYSNSNIENIGSYAFCGCSNLTSVDFPNCRTIGDNAFANCYNLSTINFPVCTNIRHSTFQNCSSLTSANFSMCTSIDGCAFANCYKLSTISFPVCTSISGSAFMNCSSLTSVNLPCTSLSMATFENCRNLTTASFPACTYIGSWVFYKCYNLISLYLTGSSYVTLGSNYETFTSTPIGGYKTSAGRYGSIYVPASMLASYKTMTNWAAYSKRFVGI